MWFHFLKILSIRLEFEKSSILFEQVESSFHAPLRNYVETLFIYLDYLKYVYHIVHMQ